jgi:metal-dependent hydrolase (beta-lactamase superfamily II)
MIQTNGSAYIIDAGAPITDTVLRAGEIFDNVRGIFTTHCHGDHIDGIFHFIDLSMWYWKNTNYDVYLTSEAVIDAIHAVIRAVSPGAKFPEERLRLHLATAETKFEDDNIKLSYIPTKHINENNLSAAMDIEIEGKHILFTGDMSRKLAKDDFPKVAFEREYDLIVCELAHFGIPEVIPYLDRVKTKRFAFTHASERKFGDIADLAASGKYQFEILHPKDGDVLEI